MKAEIVTHFKILAKLGSGGMGDVYKAIDLKLNRPVALKFLTSSLSFNPEQRKRFLNEAEAVSALDHKNICTVYEIDETDDNQIFIAMAYYEGETLKDKLLNGKIEIDQAIKIIIQAADGLLQAHQKSIIHRDIKPENIFITNEGVVKILDFGIAKFTNSDQVTKLHSTPGTIAYMSPEQIKDEKVDHRTDIWSLGVVFYEILTGRKPFNGDSDPAMIYSILNEDPPLLKTIFKNIPEKLQQVVDKWLSKEKDKRYSSMYELIKDLNALIGEKITLKKKISVHRKKIQNYFLFAVSVVVIGFLILQSILIFSDQNTLSATKIPVAVVPFENLTGDTSYNYLQFVIPSLLSTGLDQTNYFDVYTTEGLTESLDDRSYKALFYVNLDMWIEICKKENVELLLTGTLAKADSTFIANVNIFDVNTKKMKSGFVTNGIGAESLLLDQVDEMTKETARNLGLLKLADIKNLKPVSEVTTESLEAYNYYLMGKDEFDDLNWDKSKELLKKTIELDSNFAVAYAYLAIDHSYLHNIEEMNYCINKAMNLSSNVTEKEKGIIEAQYAILVELDIPKFISIYENLEKKYPREKWFHICLGFGYSKLGRTKEAVQQKEKVLELDPTHHSTLNSLGYIYVSLKDYQTAFEYFERLINAYPNDPNPHDSMGDLFLMKGDLEKSFYYYNQAYKLSKEYGSELKIAYLYALQQDFNETINWVNRSISSASSKGENSVAYCWRSFYHFLLSDYRNSFSDLLMAEKLAKNVSDTLMLSNVYILRSVFDLELSRVEESEKYLLSWYNLQNKLRSELPVRINLEYLIYSTWLKSLKDPFNNYEDSLKEMMSLDKQISDTDSKRLKNLIQFFNANILFTKNDFQKILDERPKPYLQEMEMNSRLIRYNLPIERDIYAKCYEKMGDINSAIEEYKRLAYFNPEIDERKISNPVYHYRLGILYEMNGLYQNAISEYTTFLEIYKNINLSNTSLSDAKMRLNNLVHK